jgi:hypothetical protein
MSSRGAATSNSREALLYTTVNFHFKNEQPKRAKGISFNKGFANSQLAMMA